MKKLRELRQRAGMTQEAVGRALGVTQGAIAQWESGAVAPKIDKLPTLARLYGCSVDDLFNRQGSVGTDQTA